VSVWPGVHTGVPLHEQLPQAQLDEQVWVPLVLQDWVEPGEQLPWPVQVP